MSDEEMVPGWKVIWTVTDDLGQVTFSKLYQYEAEAEDYAELKQANKKEGDKDVILESGIYPEHEWVGARIEKQEVWNFEDLSPEEQAEYHAQRDSR